MTPRAVATRKGKAMKHRVRIIGLLVFGVLATSCNKPKDEDSKAQSDQPGTAATQREKAITATKEAAQSVRVYAYAERDEFIDAANRELSDIQAEMERLRRVIDRSSGATRADAEARLKVVSDRWAAAKAQLDSAEAATEASWEDVQSRYRAARGDLKRSFDDARQWLSERIEP
jgi:hypothetical protein